MTSPATVPPLRPDQLRAQYADTLVPVSTAAIEPLERVAGQGRALEAIGFGLDVTADGYNIVVTGPAASGRTPAARQLVTERAAMREPVADWCYVHNFDDPYRPRAIALPSALGDDLKRDCAHLVERLRTDLPRAFDDESYQRRQQQVLEPIETKRKAVLADLETAAAAQHFAVNVTPHGFLTLPLGRDGAPLRPDMFAQLHPDERERLEQHGRAVQEAVNAAVREFRHLDQEARDALERLNRDVAQFVIGPTLDAMRERYAPPELRRHFDAIEADIRNNLDTFRQAEHASEGGPTAAIEAHDQILKRYEVNLFVTHGDAAAAGAPVVEERQPTYYNLFGRLDYQAHFGSMTTDFTMIRPGAIHLANGGYLLLQVQDLLQDPRSWIKLRRTLKSKQARVEDLGDTVMPFPVVNLQPEPIPLDVKVILIGPPLLFAILEAIDPDFGDLFKIRAEFEPDSPVDAHTIGAYAAFVRRSCDTCALRHFARDALEEVLRYGNRLAERQDRLSTRFGLIQDLCEEANQLAAAAGQSAVGAENVRAAIAAQQRRSDLIPDRMRRMIAEGALHIDTRGSVVGQVNGLAVYGIGGRLFGTPTRITCRVGAGTLGVINIEREVERSGAIHTKGVLVLSGYLMGTFGRRAPLSFSASLTFEQSYSEVDGDSASSAELYAILTALADLPITQEIAVTGSVDQFGNIQPVGGVTEKVEGFFDVCRQSGLTGTQGVIIPASNVINLNLRHDVVAAVEAGQFHLWAVRRVEEGLAQLTGLSAGEPDADGVYAAGTIFRRVQDRLARMEPAFIPGRVTYGSRGRPADETSPPDAGLPGAGEAHLGSP